MNVGNYVKKSKSSLRDKIAINDTAQKKVVTYNEFDQLTDYMTQHLINYGLNHSGIVMVMLENCIELQICYFACFKTGFIMQPLNYFITPDDILFASRCCKPEVFITNKKIFNEKILSIRGEMPWINNFFIIDDDFVSTGNLHRFNELLKPVTVKNFYSVTEHDFGQLFFVFTNEKTQFHRKGVLLSHWVMQWHSLPYELMQLNETDVAAGILHPYNALSRAVFKAGASYILIPHFSGELFLKYCRDFNISFLGATPGQFRQILDAAKTNKDYPKTLKACFSVGSILDNELWKEFEDIFETRVYGGMGCKELGIFSLEPHSKPTVYGSIGRILPHMEYEIENSSGFSNEQDLRQGFLNIRSNSQITHYWINNKPEIITTKNGWFSTGYEVMENEENYLFLTGTKLDKSISGHKRYYNIK